MSRANSRASALEKEMGAEMAQKLARHLPGCSIMVPVARRPLVLWMHGEGLSVSQIAARLCCNRRTVELIVARRAKN